jgi:pyruvate ferredoxin oxidoreductase alpha subunit
VGQNVRLALEGLPVRVHDVVAGLGGRAITKKSLLRMLEDGLSGDLGGFTFLDLDWDLVRKEEQRWLGSL